MPLNNGEHPGLINQSIKFTSFNYVLYCGLVPTAPKVPIVNFRLLKLDFLKVGFYHSLLCCVCCYVTYLFSLF